MRSGQQVVIITLMKRTTFTQGRLLSGLGVMYMWDEIIDTISCEIDVCDMAIAKWESRKQAWRDIRLMIEEKDGFDEIKEDD